jgi:hypothetical protein
VKGEVFHRLHEALPPLRYIRKRTPCPSR